MKERPIIFSGDMVRAILDGRKTQTRRIVTKRFGGNRRMTVPVSPITWENPKVRGGEVMFFYAAGGTSHSASPGPLCIQCPYGVAGDRLWVRETWGWDVDGAEKWGIRYAADGRTIWLTTESILAGSKIDSKWHPSIHMPRWASRITLEILKVRVERLQDISEAEAIAEGIVYPTDTAKAAYRQRWDSLHGKGAWDKNPWVWVIEFKPVQ